MKFTQGDWVRPRGEPDAKPVQVIRATDKIVWVIRQDGVTYHGRPWDFSAARVPDWRVAEIMASLRPSFDFE